MKLFWSILLTCSLCACGGGGGGSSSGGTSSTAEVSHTYAGPGYEVALLSTPLTDSASATYTLKLDLGAAVKDVYLVFSNVSNDSTSTQPRSASLAESPGEAMALAAEQAALAAGQARREGRGLKGRADVSLFNANPRLYGGDFIREKGAARSLAGGAVPEHRYDVVGGTASFRLSLGGSSLSSATCRSVVTDGSKTLNIWVADNAWAGPGCTRANCVDQAMVDALSAEFLQSGADNDIHDWVGNIFGAEWGTHNVSNLIGPTNEITILLYDIDGDNSTDGGTLGFYWSKDVYRQSSLSGSNERLMFYLDSVLFAQKDDVSWDLTDIWPQEMVGTLAHEFQHMINFYQKEVVQDLPSTETWLNEMCSMAAEDLVQTKAEFIGPRGVSWTDGTGGAAFNVEGRLPRFTRYNYIPVDTWMTGDIDVENDANELNSYSAGYAFGSYLLRNFGGAELFRRIVQNGQDGRDAVTAALQAQGYGETFETALRKWGAAVLLSGDDTNAVPDGYRYNRGGFLDTTLDGITYQLGSINLFNYHFNGGLGPVIYEELPPGDAKAGTYAGANFLFRLGTGLTGSISRDFTLPKGTKMTLVVQ